MSSLPLSDDLAAKAAKAYLEAGGNQTLAAGQLGIPRGTLANRLRRAAERGMLLDVAPAMPGFRISQVTDGPAGRSIQQRQDRGGEFVVPNGHVIRGVSALLDPDGREIVKWVKTKEGVFDPTTLVEWIKNAFVDVKPAKSIKAPKAIDTDLLTLIPVNDWHVGMFAWASEVEQNWDLKIAERVIGNGIRDVIVRSPASAEAIVLGGGDLMHSDSQLNETTAGTPQDVDGRYPKVLQTITRMAVRTIYSALARHRHVTVRILPGNHDEDTSVAIGYFLLAWFRDEPRVTVDVDPSLFFWFRFGKVLLGATHGHTVKIGKMPSIMAHRRAEDWGATKFRYCHGFHLHHSAKTATEDEGVICETHQAPIPLDAWHFGKGYLSGRSLQAITYHRDFGEIGRVRTAILDEAA